MLGSAKCPLEAERPAVCVTLRAGRASWGAGEGFGAPGSVEDSVGCWQAEPEAPVSAGLAL